MYSKIYVPLLINSSEIIIEFQVAYTQSPTPHYGILRKPFLNIKQL